MKLHVIGTGSKGNSYALRSSTGEILLIECGVHLNEIKKAVEIENVAGCIVTHSHQDHCQSINELMSSGVEVYASVETLLAVSKSSTHNQRQFKKTDTGYLQQQIGQFTVLPFAVKHDVHCLGFIIYHPECGKVLFLTDTYYCPFKFNGLNHIICEANYSKKVLNAKFKDDDEMYFLRNRIVKSHMSLETCIDLLNNNNLQELRNIILIHLSDSNSDEKLFIKEVTDQVGRVPKVASNGNIYELSL